MTSGQKCWEQKTQQRGVCNKAIWYAQFKMKNVKYIYPMIKSLHKGSKTGRNSEGGMKATDKLGWWDFIRLPLFTLFFSSYGISSSGHYCFFFFFLMTKKSSESWVVMGLCDREKHPIIGRRGSWNTSKKSEMAFICLRQEFNRIYLEQTSAIHLTTFSIFAIYALPFP